jgi:dTDP-4-dehydrorhamnose reductase
MNTSSQMEVLVLGGTGMLGHKMFQRLRKRFPQTFTTIRGSLNDPVLCNIELFHSGNVFDRFDATDIPALTKFLSEHRPKVIVNCIGVIKQRSESKDALASILGNAMLPHKLVEICSAWGGRIVHFSTDCVFSGRRGHYKEEDMSDAEDFYGRTKFLGELAAGNALTLRTSMIGRELFNFRSLLEWFLSQDHTSVRGFKHAMYSGTTTNELTKIVGDLIERRPELTGLYQITGPAISKFLLLSLVSDAYGLDIEIVPDETFFCDRSMSGDKFQLATGYSSPGWPELIEDLVTDETPYESWRALTNEVL